MFLKELGIAIVNKNIYNWLKNMLNPSAFLCISFIYLIFGTPILSGGFFLLLMKTKIS